MRHLLLPSTIIVSFVFCVISNTVFAQEIEELSLTPFPTIEITPTPTVTSVPLQTVMSVEKLDGIVLTAGVEGIIPVVIHDAEPNSLYSVKVLIKDNDSVINKTKVKENTWVAWNAAWNTFPVIATNENGEGTLDVTIFILEDTDSCSCEVVARLRSETNKNSDFSIGHLKVVKSEQQVIPELEKLNETTKELITDVKQLEIGTQVVIEGVVTSDMHELGKNIFYIEDETGGIKVVLKDEAALYVKGTILEVRGLVSDAYNEMYLKVDDNSAIQEIGQDSLPDPLDVQTGEVGEVYEGKVVRVNGEVSATSGNTFFVNDGSGNVKVFIKDSTEIVKPKMRKGYYAAVTGIVSQYTDDYRILPRIQEDLIVAVLPIDPKVLGSVSVLPETGISESRLLFLSVFFLSFGVLLRGMLWMIAKYRMCFSSNG